MPPQSPTAGFFFASLMCVVSIMVVIVASDSTPKCQHECGGIPIPHPFGIGDNCSWPGFDVFPITCNLTFDPPRPFLGTMEIISIKPETAEMRLYEHVSYACFNSTDRIEHSSQWWFDFSPSPFLISPTQNKFVALGCDTIAMLSGRENGTYSTGCVSYCASASEVQVVGDGKLCTGLGCCETPNIAPNISNINFYLAGDKTNNSAWSYSPCIYGFVADKTSDIKISKADVVGNMTFAQRFERGVPLVLDWAIRNNGTCSSPTPSGGKNGKQQTSACVSVNSHCVNATNGLGYICKCSLGYTGNPYVSDGCKNIDECKENPCIGGTCHDTEGGFECKCNFGRRRDSEDDNACQPVLTKPAIVAIATLCAISILAIILLFLHMEREKRKLRDFFQKNDGQLLKTMGIKIFKKKEIDRITNNYGKILGKGGFGLVYMGITDSKQQVAVKCPNPISVDPARQKDFTNEVTIQSQISHKNVVRLLGCCLETNIPMLVYEFIPKGSLHDVLHGNSDDSNVVAKSTLSLQVRLGIAIESTEALNYMHSSASQKIIHGDVKSSNILLDENFTPKVSDFGISRLLSIDKHHTKFVIGDANYMDPIYMKTGLLTEKSDVYSFGVVLLELITRKKARYDGNKSLSLTFVKSYMTECRAREMFDEEITCNTEDINCLEMISRIAVECLQEDVDKRPTMKEVLEYLHLARKEWMQRQGKISCDQADEIAIDYSPLTHHSYPA